MRKRLLCAMVAAVLLLGVLAGCGGGSSGSSDPDKPGVESTKPNNSGHTDSDPLAIMQERVKAVNDAINYECVGLEETVEAGLLFYNLCDLAFKPSLQNPDYGKPHDYNPNKPLDYRVRYEVHKGRTEGIVSEDTYAALLRDLCQNKIPFPGVFSVEDVIETDDLYVYYSPQSDGTRDYRPWCYFLVKDTNIAYWFIVEESWSKADYYEHGNYNYVGGTLPQGYVDLRYIEDDAEYIFTAEFWKAYAQTVKFVGDVDDDSKMNNYVQGVSSADRRGTVNIPYVEEWYAGGAVSQDTIRRGFEEFLNNNCDYEVEVFFNFNDGTEKTYPATKRGDEVTIDLGNGQVWIYVGNTELELSEEPQNITGEHFPEIGYLKYIGNTTNFLAIDDFGQGEPTMFLNNALYRYAPGGEGVTLIHDFSDTFAGLSEDWWMSMSIDADSTCLLFSGEPIYGESLKIVDLKTFEITDEVNIYMKQGEDYITEFASADVNGASVDEETARAKIEEWCSIYNIHLLSRWSSDFLLSFDAAWRGYESRG